MSKTFRSYTRYTPALISSSCELSVVPDNSYILRMLFYASLLGFILVLALGASPSQSSFGLVCSIHLHSVYDFSLVSLP